MRVHRRFFHVDQAGRVGPLPRLLLPARRRIACREILHPLIWRIADIGVVSVVVRSLDGLLSFLDMS